MFANLLQALYSQTHDRIKVFDKCFASSFLFYFVIDEVMEDVLGGFPDAGVELADGEKLRNQDYVYDLLCSFESTGHSQHALDILVRAVGPLDVVCTFRVSSAVTRLATVMPNLILNENELGIVDHFSYFSNLSKHSGTVVKVGAYIQGSNSVRWIGALEAPA